MLRKKMRLKFVIYMCVNWVKEKKKIIVMGFIELVGLFDDYDICFFLLFYFVYCVFCYFVFCYIFGRLFFLL